MAKQKGYLIFTTHDRDELDATFITDTEFFKQLLALPYKNNPTQINEDVMSLWTEYRNKHPNLKRGYFAQAPGDYKWPFKDVEILGTYYILVY